MEWRNDGIVGPKSGKIIFDLFIPLNPLFHPSIIPIGVKPLSLVISDNSGQLQHARQQYNSGALQYIFTRWTNPGLIVQGLRNGHGKRSGRGDGKGYYRKCA